MYDLAVEEVNMYVKPVGLSAIKFLYTDWMDPDDSRNNAREEHLSDTVQCGENAPKNVFYSFLLD